ncbi:MAG: multiple antibiotic resistance protein [Actinomycetota bacterium]|nr:multiple antibiotic resistance protein [Actinomycetota bacterium]
MLFAQVFVTLLVIMDPVGNVPVFLAVTDKEGAAERRRAAAQAALTAAAVILAFAAFGGILLRLLGISVQALQVSGGLLLVLVALELLQQPMRPTGSQPATTANVAFVPLGTPLLAGPGAIAATMVYIRDAGDWRGIAIVVGALVCVFVIVYLVLRLANVIARFLKESGVALLARIVGLLLAAIATQLLATGIQHWIRHGV